MKKIIFIVILLIISIILYINVNASVVIPNEAIRIRVIPNSNSITDQNIKEEVKNYVSNYMFIKLYDVKDIDEAREIIKDNIDDLYIGINDIFKRNNYDKDYKIVFGDNYFPDKIYKGIIYNEGNYESLVIYIGDAYGDNWWCVLFPPLCLLEATESDTGDVEYRSLVKDLLSNFFGN